MADPILSDEDCRQAAPRAVPYRRRADDGLYLRIEPTRKVWRWDYTFGGKPTIFTIGLFPAIGLQQAQRLRDEAKAQVAEGKRPASVRKAAKEAAELAQRQIFGLVAEELLDKMAREGRAAATLKKNRWLMTELAADLYHRPIKHITPVDILSVLRQAERRGRLESARRLRSAIGQVMRYGVATGRAHTDPTPALRGAIAVPRVKHRPAVIEPKAVGKLMEAVRGYEGKVVRQALLLMAYCFPRPGELRLAKWDEVDTRNRVWTVPAERAKMRREHRIPLSDQAVKEFNALRKISGESEDGFCFPSLREGRPMSEATLNAALRTLGYDSKTQHCAHGFRATASSILHEHSAFSSEIIERALGHVDQNAVRKAYNRATYWDERVKLAQWYADFLDRQRHGVWKERILA